MSGAIPRILTTSLVTALLLAAALAWLATIPIAGIFALFGLAFDVAIIVVCVRLILNHQRRSRR